LDDPDHPTQTFTIGDKTVTFSAKPPVFEYEYKLFGTWTEVAVKIPTNQVEHILKQDTRAICASLTCAELMEEDAISSDKDPYSNPISFDEMRWNVAVARHRREIANARMMRKVEEEIMTDFKKQGLVFDEEQDEWIPADNKLEEVVQAKAMYDIPYETIAIDEPVKER
jgi:hypothetical protein